MLVFCDALLGSFRIPTDLAGPWYSTQNPTQKKHIYISTPNPLDLADIVSTLPLPVCLLTRPASRGAPKSGDECEMVRPVKRPLFRAMRGLVSPTQGAQQPAGSDQLLVPSSSSLEDDSTVQLCASSTKTCPFRVMPRLTNLFLPTRCARPFNRRR